MSRPADPRLEPLPLERWGDEERAALEQGYPAAADAFLSGTREAPRVPNVLGVLMHHPELAQRFLLFNRVLLEAPTLGHRLRELLVLRVAWRTRARYEWVQHVRLAKQVGITPEEIEATTRPLGGDGSGSVAWKPVEADLLAAADQLLERHCIQDATWSRLAEHLDRRQLVEVVFVVGAYTCLSMAFNSFDVQLDPGLEPDPELPVPE